MSRAAAIFRPFFAATSMIVRRRRTEFIAQFGRRLAYAGADFDHCLVQFRFGSARDSTSLPLAKISLI